MTEKVIVNVNEGKVRGFKAKTAFSGAEYYSFLGVPYGQSTEGSARFKDPVKAKPWKNIFDATTERNGCTQFAIHFRKLQGTENCLYNNIHTPKIPSKGDSLKAVVVCIHPGGFFHGAPDPQYYGAPQYIMHHDIVYVCVGYRLHILGNLNLHLESCSGNQSTKDIILSLQWIKENIHAFGGDPSNVTIMGSSSGAALVHVLLLSHLANGLYHKAILMGMYAFNPVLVTHHKNVQIAYEIAQTFGYDGQPTEHKRLLTFYKQMNLVPFIASKPEQFMNKSTLQVFPTSTFLPTGEPRDNSPVLKSLNDLIPTTNRVPIIIGFCEREAAMGLALLRSLKRSISACFNTIIKQNVWGWGANLKPDQLKQIQKEVENFYLEGESIENASQEMLCDILTDAALSEVYDTLINVISADLPESVYVYKFQYDGKLCTMRSKIERYLEKPLQGAFHAADYSYWCYSQETAGKNISSIQPNDREMVEKFTGIMTTFAKTGNPNDYEGMKINWKPTTLEHPSHLVMNETFAVRDEILNGPRLEFWHGLKKKFNNE